MINPNELIQDYKDQGFTTEEAVQMAKEELQERKVIGLKNNQENTIKELNNPSRMLSEETSRNILTKRNYST